MVETEFHYVRNEITKFSSLTKVETQTRANNASMILISDHQGISLMNENLPTQLATSKKRLPNKEIELHMAYAVQINHHILKETIALLLQCYQSIHTTSPILHTARPLA
jgi:hypothetical protein